MWPRSEVPVCCHSSHLPPLSLLMTLLPGIQVSLSISTELLSLDSDERRPVQGLHRIRAPGMFGSKILHSALCASTGRMTLGF